MIQKRVVVLITFGIELIIGSGNLWAQSIVDSAEVATNTYRQTVTATQDSLTQPVDSIQHKLQEVKEKANQFNALSRQPEQKIRNTVTGQKNVQQTQQAVDVVDQETQVTQQAGLSAPNVPTLTPDTGLEASPPLLSVPKSKTAELNFVSSKGIADLLELPDGIGKLNQSWNSYSKDLTALRQGKLTNVKAIPEAIEGQVGQIDQLQELQQQSGALEEFTSQPDSYRQQMEQYQNQENLKQQAQNKLIEKSVDHFVGQNETVAQARQTLDQSKRKYARVQTEQNKFVRATSLKNTPTIERLVPGLRLQVHQGPPTAFDLSPFVGYRFNTRWLAGLGSSYRLALDSKKKLIRNHPVYGGHIFIERLFYKSLLVHAQYELLRANVSALSVIAEQERTTASSVLIGAGKQYGITKKVKGNILFLYNLVDHSNGPYPTRWNIQMSFFWVTKKRTPQTKEPSDSSQN